MIQILIFVLNHKCEDLCLMIIKLVVNIILKLYNFIKNQGDENNFTMRFKMTPNQYFPDIQYLEKHINCTVYVHKVTT